MRTKLKPEKKTLKSIMITVAMVVLVFTAHGQDAGKMPTQEEADADWAFQNRWEQIADRWVKIASEAHTIADLKYAFETLKRDRKQFDVEWKQHTTGMAHISERMPFLMRVAEYIYSKDDAATAVIDAKLNPVR